MGVNRWTPAPKKLKTLGCIAPSIGLGYLQAVLCVFISLHLPIICNLPTKGVIAGVKCV